MTTALITQSNYIPWRGYFDLMHSADIFIVLDNVQYTRRDWRNRNRLHNGKDLEWLSIAVQNKGNYHARIQDIQVQDTNWAAQHMARIAQHYKHAPCYTLVMDWLEPLYTKAATCTHLTDINQILLRGIGAQLGITTPMQRADTLIPLDQQDGMDAHTRILALCEAVGATRYISGPAAQSYMQLEDYHTRGIKVQFADYSHYPAYAHHHGYIAGASIIDTLMQLGTQAAKVSVGFAVHA